MHPGRHVIIVCDLKVNFYSLLSLIVIKPASIYVGGNRWILNNLS